MAATYHQVWWPHVDDPVYTGTHLPVWDDRAGGYVDPNDGLPLQTWEQALGEIDDDPSATPVHVLRFGKQTDYQGLLGGTRDSERRIGYLCKYLTKSVADTYGDGDTTSARQKAHIDRLHEEVRWHGRGRPLFGNRHQRRRGAPLPVGAKLLLTVDEAAEALGLSRWMAAELWSVERYLTYWLEEVVRPQQRPKTYQGYAGVVRNHLVPCVRS